MALNVVNALVALVEGYSDDEIKDILKYIQLKVQVQTPATRKQLLQTLLDKMSMKEAAQRLNVAIGTVQRWVDLDHIPHQYKFDLLRLLARDINYSEYKSSEKDQFFTPDHIVEKCWSVFNEVVLLNEININEININEININEININAYTFIEPSAGDGAFLKVLPKNTIALDIEPRHNSIVKQDYLLWQPADKTKKYIVFGNPPFGLRGHMALNFINHSSPFADYVCFILPQLFESDGKGSPRKRIVGYNLIYSEKMSALFYTPENTNVSVNAVFQIWSKVSTNAKYNLSTPPQDIIKVYSLSDGGTVASTRNKKMLDKCDIYLPSTCFGKENMKLYERFIDLPGQKGYGIVFLKNKESLLEKSRSIDWSAAAFLSTNSAYNLRTSIIIDRLSL